MSNTYAMNLKSFECENCGNIGHLKLAADGFVVCTYCSAAVGRDVESWPGIDPNDVGQLSPAWDKL